MAKTYNVLGLMSGTSLDGLDIAFCSFNKDKIGKWQYRIIAATTINYSEEIKLKLKSLPDLSSLELLKAHHWFGDFCGEMVNEFITTNALHADFIASHGHTVFHNPAAHYTLQIGSGANIHAKTNLPVVCDFRTVDVALGGQGAPLVPVGDQLLFSTYTFCLNLGGIANISFDSNGNRIAYDICPVNIVLNALTTRFNAALSYDHNGDIARSGTIVDPLLEKLESLAYYQHPPPKSLGKEWIDAEVFPLLEKFSTHSIPDLLCTFCHHIAKQVAGAVINHCHTLNISNSQLQVTGGGALNGFLIELFRHYMVGTIQVVIPDEKTIMFKEALIFAFLGVLRMESENNCLASVTGAQRDNIGGAVYGNLS